MSPTNQSPSAAPNQLPSGASLSRICLQASFAAEADDVEALFRTLQTRLPACGAWVCDGAIPVGKSEGLRFEVLLSAAWELYALLLSLGLELTPASHWELCTLCSVCRNLSARAAGKVIDMELRIFSAEPVIAPASRAV